MAHTSISGFPARLRHLVDLNAGGNVRAAARQVGISHPALLSLLSGNTNPRVSTLANIATAYNVSRAWLLDGDGDGPSLAGPAGGEAWEEWNALVYSLSLGVDATVELLEFPLLTSTVTNLFVAPDIIRLDDDEQSDEQARRLRAIEGEVMGAWNGELLSWTRLFRRWIDAAGVERVREVVLANRDGFRSRSWSVDGDDGSNPLATELSREAQRLILVE